jgi:hypothetical protein
MILIILAGTHREFSYWARHYFPLSLSAKRSSELCFCDGKDLSKLYSCDLGSPYIVLPGFMRDVEQEDLEATRDVLLLRNFVEVRIVEPKTL